MANGEVADCEAGTSLPVPPAFDQCSQASIEDGDEAAASAGEADLEDPLVIEQEELFGPAELDPSFGSEEGIASGSEAPVGSARVDAFPRSTGQRARLFAAQSKRFPNIGLHDHPGNVECLPGRQLGFTMGKWHNVSCLQ